MSLLVAEEMWRDGRIDETPINNITSFFDVPP
jgi:hypothetical protein